MNSEIKNFVQVAWRLGLSVGVGIKSMGDQFHTTFIVARYRSGANFASASALKANVMKMKSGGIGGNSCFMNLRMFCLLRQGGSNQGVALNAVDCGDCDLLIQLQKFYLSVVQNCPL